MDLDAHLVQLIEKLDKIDGYYLPGSDLEARWVADAPSRRVLSPSRSALALSGKPFDAVEAHLPVRCPPTIRLDAGPREVYNFAVAHGWDAWAKGPVMDARRVGSWAHLQAVWSDLIATWGEQPFFLQANVRGRDATVAFAAYEGRLLGTAFLDKLQVTGDGKCWAGEVNDCPEALHQAIGKLVDHLGWTGGGELEFVRDAGGDLWLIDLNHRFPAWIHGATLAGKNLPGLLMEAATGVKPMAQRCESRQFTRVVLEVPVLTDLPLPPPPKDPAPGILPSKMLVSAPGGLPDLMRRLARTDGPAPDESEPEGPREAPPPIDPKLAHSIDAAVAANQPSPARILLEDWARDRFDLVKRVIARPRPVRLTPGYSIKTNPDARLMEMARLAGFRAEAISLEEAFWAREMGFRLDEMIYNGPVPIDHARLDGERFHVVFADSLESFTRLCGLQPRVASVIGLRLSPFGVGSRFGSSLADPVRFRAITDAIIRHLPYDVDFGVHYHVQSSSIGTAGWLGNTRAFIELAKSLETVTERAIRVFDVGGGWTSESFVPFLSDDLDPLLAHLHERLPGVEEVVCEPGKAVCEQSQILL